LPPQEQPLVEKSQQLQLASRGRGSLIELAGLFLRLGTIAFGGPPSHIAMMEDEVVTRRAWLTREQFLDFLGAANLIPGPTSTELAIYVGRTQAGWVGLLVAGSCFILPSSIMVATLAWLYMRYGSLPQMAGFFYGVKPVVIALIVLAVVKLARSAVKSVWLALLCLLAVLAFSLGLNELLVLAGGALVAGFAHRFRSNRDRRLPSLPALLKLSGLYVGAAATSTFSLAALFLVFLKIGAILFGGGYVLIALLRSNLVARLGWISERQLLDAIAMGQVTPGPISTAATFIGFIVGGLPGATVATIAMFLPAFLFVGVSGPLIPRLRRSPLAGTMLDGVNVAALALIAVVAWQLSRTAIVDWITLVVAGISLLLLSRYRVNSTWLILAGAVLGAAKFWLHF